MVGVCRCTETHHQTIRLSPGRSPVMLDLHAHLASWEMSGTLYSKGENVLFPYTSCQGDVSKPKLMLVTSSDSSDRRQLHQHCRLLPLLTVGQQSPSQKY